MERTEIKEEKPYWVAFNVFQGIGPKTFALLRKYFGSARRAWEAEEGDLVEILGGVLWEKFRDFRREFEPEGYFKSLTSLSSLKSNGIHTEVKVLIEPDGSYPELLREIEDAPPVLYAIGKPDLLLKPQIGVVGTRKMTSYGAKTAVELTSGLVGAGYAITSGLAYGIDTVAHRAALRDEGETVAVLGCGVDICYPRDHYRIYQRIIESGRGVIVSEIPPGMRTRRGIFVARNRIISGLSLGVLIVEGAKKSGTLITAGYAAAQGREVFAVPGPITSRFSDGPNLLIKEGAKAVTGVEDILEEFTNIVGAQKAVRVPDFSREMLELSDDERRVIEILKGEGVGNIHMDEIVRRTGIESGKVGSLLSMLELKGLVTSNGGGRYGVVV